MLPTDRQQRIAEEAERLRQAYPRGVDEQPAERGSRWMLSETLTVRLLAFTGAFCAVIAQSEAIPDLIRYVAAAIAAGASAVLALTRAPGQSKPPEAGNGRG